MKTDSAPSRLKILMLAPEPFFQPRGTPISIYFRLKGLSDLGHEIDLITYPVGEDRSFPGVRILRTANPFKIKTVKIGPSFKKIILDIFLSLKALHMIFKKRYDLVFSHEEAGWIGTPLARLRGIPHIYDMHSSLPQQLRNFQATRSRLIIGIFHRLEKAVLRRSSAVIVICPDLLNTVQAGGYADKTVLLENFIDFDSVSPSEAERKALKKKYAPRGEKIILYAGNFQPYQGVDLLLDAAVMMKDDHVVFVLVGGKGEELERIRRSAETKGIIDRITFTGQVPPAEVPRYITLADVLVSPRISGTNTPLKIYSFLKSGKPLVATRLWTHTQVLNDKISILVEPEAGDMAAGIHLALNDPAGADTSQAALSFSRKEYTIERYREKISQVLQTALEGRKSR